MNEQRARRDSYSILMERFTVLSWDGGRIGRLKSDGYHWVSGEELVSNEVANTGIVWMPVPSDYKGEQVKRIGS